MPLIMRVASVTQAPARKLVLLEHARTIGELADGSVGATYDRVRINDQLRGVREALHAGDQLPSLILKKTMRTISA